jgi:hypothetical protein
MSGVYVSIVGATGAISNGTAERIIIDGTDSIAEQLAQKTVTAVRSQLDNVLKNPTGYYKSQISADKVQNGSYSVSDSGVVYGPWLEGVSSRNDTTSFKGYHTFEIVSQEIEPELGSAIDEYIDKLLEKVAGE